MPTLDDNQEDWQLVPDANGKLHLVDIKSEVASDIEPSFIGIQDMIFRLHTRQSVNAPKVIRINNETDLANSLFNPLHPTRYLIHGWLGGGDDDNGKWLL